MAEPLGQMLAGARSRWIIGGEAAPPDHPLTQGQPAAEADLRLLAVAGQFRRFCQAPAPPALTQRPDLPPLALPVLPDALRPLARRMLHPPSDRAAHLIAVFTARRGHVLHPVDWMPPAGADLPEVYRPLQIWRADRLGKGTDLTEETWLALSRAERLDQVAARRQTDPAAALGLLSANIAQCPADERLALVETLATGLGPDDVPFLQSLSTDRSDKVRKAAAHFLARLGVSEADPLASEAAAMFELATEGLIRRRRVLRLVPKAKEGQLRSLIQTLPEITLPGLARALGLAPADVVALWDLDKAPAPVQAALSAMIARTAADADLVAYWHRLGAQPDIARTSLPLLFPRLSAADRQAACLWLIAQTGPAAAPDILALAGPAAPAPVSAALAADPGALIAALMLSRDTTPEKTAAARAEAQRLAHILASLGLLLTAADAARMIGTMTGAGVHPADPILDHLSFNAALKGS
jgi:hypothetical protein